MKALNISFLFFMSFFLLQSMNNTDAKDEIIKYVLLKSPDFSSRISSSGNYPIEKMEEKKFAQKLSPSQRIAVAPDVLKRDDSPPALKKTRKKRVNGVSKVCNRADTKKQLLEDQKKIELKLRDTLEKLSKENADKNKMRKSASESDVLLETLRKIHVKKDEESSEEEN